MLLDRLLSYDVTYVASWLSKTLIIRVVAHAQHVSWIIIYTVDAYRMLLDRPLSYDATYVMSPADWVTHANSIPHSS